MLPRLPESVPPRRSPAACLRRWPLVWLAAWPALGPGAAPAAELPVRSVVLSSAGLAQVERAGTLAPDARGITLVAPTADVDDILKSLLLRDPSGRIEGLRLPAQDAAAEAFRGLPLRPEDFSSRAALLRALRGQAVEAGGATGRLVDAEEGPVVGAGTDAATLRLALVTPEGVRVLRLREGEAVRLLDTALAARIARAAEALAAVRAEGSRTIEIALSAAPAPREVSLTTVTGAPLWKPTWRLLVPGPEAPGEARLQGWAVVENRSGADWDGVRLALVSGNPASYRQPLYRPIEVARPVLPVRVAEQVAARADTGARPVPPPPSETQALIDRLRMGGSSPNRGIRVPQEASAAMAPAPMPLNAPGPLPAQAPLAALAEAEAAGSAGGRVAFTLAAPATIRSGETASVPFLDARLPADRVWWVQDLSARHPLQAVRLRNTTEHLLPDGLATLYGLAGTEDGAFLGDAEIRAMPPGEVRLLPFARDREIALAQRSSTTELPTGIAFRPGIVQVATLWREEIAIGIEPRGAKGRIVLDLPRRPGMAPRFQVEAEGDFGLRTEAALDGTPTTLRFAWERAGWTETPLWDPGLGDPLLLRWRQVELERELRRLPGGPGTLETLRTVLERLPADAPGRGALAGLADALAEARRRLDAAREAIRGYATADESLRRARAAAEDRTGPEREEARRALSAASVAAERAGAAADAAWEAWQRQVQAVMARTG